MQTRIMGAAIVGILLQSGAASATDQGPIEVRSPELQFVNEYC